MKDKTTNKKILKDRTFPDSTQIGKYQDFERVQKDYGMIRKLLVKKTIAWCAAALSVAGVAGAVLLGKPAAEQQPAVIAEAVPPAIEKQAFVQPPLAGHETPFASYRICATTGGLIHHPTGSMIEVPANAFVKPDGSPVSDTVEIRYREFHDPLAIFLSGIPMEYDSAGVVRTFESAGMIEVLAFDEGQPLALKEQAPLQVHMASATADERFNLYVLDTVQKNWVYLGKDQVKKPAGTDTRPVKQKESTTREMAGSSITPQLADPQQYSFRISYEKGDFPELAAYDNVLFEVTDRSFNPAYYKVNWKKIELYTGDAPGYYIVKLKKADTTISVIAKPVFDKASYAHAMAAFEQKHTASRKERDQKEQVRQEVLEKTNRELAGYSGKNMVAAAYRLLKLENIRSFPVTNLGIYNADFPLPPLLQFAYSFQRQAQRTVEAKRELAYSTIFMVEQGRNAVFRFAKGEPVRCNPNAKNLMWTLTDKNEIAFFRIGDYNKLVNGGVNVVSPVVARSQELAFEEIRKFSGS